jgi:hypothetical protein
MNMARGIPVAGAKTWLAEREELTPDVERIFVEESGKRNTPSKDAYRTIADALLAVRARVTAAPLRQANIAAGIFRADITPSLDGARKSATALLRHLDPIRQRLADEARERETLGLDPAHCEEKIELLTAAAEAVDSLFSILDAHPLVPRPDRDPSLFIAEKVQEAWAEANDGRSPRSKDAGGPLVIVVTRLLALVLKKQKPETVSARLKLRRGSSKLGRIKRLKTSQEQIG